MNRTLAALALCLSFAAPIAAQEKGPQIQFPRATTIPPGVTPVAPAPPSLAPVDAPRLVPGTTIVPFATIPPQLPGGVVPTQSREHYAVPANIDLKDGTTLTGEIHSDGPLQCMAIFGQTAIPFNQIKGIEWQSRIDEQDEQVSQATLVLINGDSLTVSVTVPAIQIKTTWGHATVELSHVRSMLMTIEKVEWADTPDGRRVLVPVGEAPDAAKPK